MNHRQHRLILCLLLVAMVSHVAIADWSVAPSSGVAKPASARPVTRASLNRVKRLARNLSKPDSPGLSQAKLDQLRRIGNRAGGNVTVHLEGVKGTGVRPHAHLEGLGSKVRNRHIWLQEGVE